MFLSACSEGGDSAASGSADPSPAAVAPGSPGASDQKTPPPGIFEELGQEAGLAFQHFNGMSGEYYFHEMMGAGVALLDYDGDGDLDVYLVQGHMVGPEKGVEEALIPPAEGETFRDRLFRNDLERRPSGETVLRFTDVTEESGINARGYGMGVAVGDVDNDGWPDLYVTNYGANQLWRNRGDGTFEDATARAGVGDPRWSVPAVFWDYDKDGWLDLFVGNYVDFSVATHKRCTTDLGRPNYCGPLAYEPQGDVLFRNRGDGTFEDVTGRAGLRSTAGGALGAITADVNGDGWLDLYVANDGVPNALWVNQGDGTFQDEALLSGSAVNAEGQPEASMGIDVADLDGDGDEDLFMTHLTRETNTLYLNAGDGTFVDASVTSGLGAPSFEKTGFGTAFIDVDNDADLDLLVVNGAVKVIEELALAGDPFPLHQQDQLFLNRGGGVFEDVPAAEAGGSFHRSEVGRGVAVGDLDNDGDPDVLVTNNAGPARILVNRTISGAEAPDVSWIGLRLLDGHGREALGAMAEITAEDRPPVVRRVRTAGSYASASDPRILVGLGPAGGASAEVLVRWPGSEGPAVEVFRKIPTGSYSTLKQGEGEEVPAP